MAAQNGIAPLQQQPEQVQVSDPLPHAMGYTPPDGDRYVTCPVEQANTFMQYQAGPQQHSQAPQSVLPDGAMGVGGELYGWRADGSAGSYVAYPSDIQVDPAAGNANTFGSDAFSSSGNVSTVSDMFKNYVNMDGNKK